MSGSTRLAPSTRRLHARPVGGFDVVFDGTGSNTEETRLLLVFDGAIDRINNEAMMAMIAGIGS